jgi:uncharacterized membrane protein
MGWLGAFVMKNFDATLLHELMHWSHQFGPFCTEVLAVTKQSKMPKTWVWVQMGWIGCVHREKYRHDFVARTCALITPVRLVLHRSSCINETVRNTPKHEFGFKWGGSGSFVAKNSDTTLLHELVHQSHMFGQFCTEVRAVTKQSKTPQNNRCRRDFVARTCALSAQVRHVFHRSSCSNETVWKAPKIEFGVQWGRSGAFVVKNSNTTSLHEVVH